MIVDIHCHYLSPRVREAVQREGERYGVRVAEVRDGEPVLQLGRQRPWRGLFPEIQDLAQRQQAMADQAVDHQVLSTWLDCTGYDLPPAEGMRWARLLNDTMEE